MTDKCPLPVLAVSLLLGFGAVAMALSGLGYRAVIPWFGTLLDGPAGLAVLLVFVFVLAGLAWGTYQLRKWAWIGSISRGTSRRASV